MVRQNVAGSSLSSVETAGGVLLWEKMKDGTLWVHFQGDVYVFHRGSRRQKKGGDFSESPQVIKAPMPGKVIQLLKNEGDLVQEGDVIVVMEAMKMEYNLKSIKSGTVSQITCQVGDQVPLGRHLVHIKIEDVVQSE